MGQGKSWALDALQELIVEADPYWARLRGPGRVGVPGGNAPLPSTLWLRHQAAASTPLSASLLKDLAEHAQVLEALARMGTTTTGQVTGVLRHTLRVVASAQADQQIGNLLSIVGVPWAKPVVDIVTKIGADIRTLSSASPPSPDEQANALAHALRRACSKRTPAVIAIDNLLQVPATERLAFLRALAARKFAGVSITLVCTLPANESPLLEAELNHLGLDVEEHLHVEPMTPMERAELCRVVRPDIDEAAVCELIQRLETPAAIVQVLRSARTSEHLLEIARAAELHSGANAVYDAAWAELSEAERHRLAAWFVLADALGWRDTRGPLTDAAALRWFWAEVCPPTPQRRLAFLRRFDDGTVGLAD